MMIALLLHAAMPERGAERCRAAADEYSRRATLALSGLASADERARLLRGEQYRAGILMLSLKAWRAGPAAVRNARALSHDALEARMAACETEYGPKEE